VHPVGSYCSIQSIPYKEHRLRPTERPIREGCILKELLCIDKPQH